MASWCARLSSMRHRTAPVAAAHTPPASPAGRQSVARRGGRRMRSCSDVHNLLIGEGIPTRSCSCRHLSARRNGRQSCSACRPPRSSSRWCSSWTTGPCWCSCRATPRGHDRAGRAVGCRQVRWPRRRRCWMMTGYRRGAVPPCGLAHAPARGRRPARVRAAGRLLRRRHDHDHAQDAQRDLRSLRRRA